MNSSLLWCDCILHTLKSLLAMPQAKQAGVTEEMVLKVLAEINPRK